MATLRGINSAVYGINRYEKNVEDNQKNIEEALCRKADKKTIDILYSKVAAYSVDIMQAMETEDQLFSYVAVLQHE